MKKYRVDFLDWYGGEFKSFWFKRNAMRHIKIYEDCWLWIDLTNNWTGKTERLKSTDTSKYYRTERGEYLLIKKEKK